MFSRLWWVNCVFLPSVYITGSMCNGFCSRKSCLRNGCDRYVVFFLALQCLTGGCPLERDPAVPGGCTIRLVEAIAAAVVLGWAVQRVG